MTVPKKRGRPKLENAKRHVSIRLDADVLEKFRSTGIGWQSRVNEALRRELREMEKLASEPS